MCLGNRKSFHELVSRNYLFLCLSHKNISSLWTRFSVIFISIGTAAADSEVRVPWAVPSRALESSLTSMLANCVASGKSHHLSSVQWG